MNTHNYLELNRKSWDARTIVHVESEFYAQNDFLKGKNSLNEIELNLLNDVNGKKILHLQCHFGQDTLSLARMGAKVTGVDFSALAIRQAEMMAEQLRLEARFICCDVYDLPNHLDEQFDIVFTTYGTIGWLPDIHKWASLISHFLKPTGQLVFAEFHPAMWMFDNDFETVAYRYFQDEAIIEVESGTYADKKADIEIQSVTWNHSLSEVLQSLLKAGLKLDSFEEFDYSPYNCLNGMIEVMPNRYQIEKMGNKLPLVYALKMTK